MVKVSADKPRITREIVERYVRDGLTTTQMAERFLVEYGERRSDRSFAVAMHRMGIPSPHPRKKYDDELPWTVRKEHLMATEARMLRAYGRLRAGEAMAPDTAERLASWMRKLDEMDAVVHYDPETEQGFFLVPRRPGDDGYTRRPDEGENDGR